jgi:hypothetical protein
MTDIEAIHPPRDRLAAYALGRLHGPEMDEIERHLSSCDSCCRAMEDQPEDSLLLKLRARGASTAAATAAGGEPGGEPPVGSEIPSSFAVGPADNPPPPRPGDRDRPVPRIARLGRVPPRAERPPPLPGRRRHRRRRHGGRLPGRASADGSAGRPQGHPPLRANGTTARASAWLWDSLAAELSWEKGCDAGLRRHRRRRGGDGARKRAANLCGSSAA